jgi:hypothetical protein
MNDEGVTIKIDDGIGMSAEHFLLFIQTSVTAMLL